MLRSGQAMIKTGSDLKLARKALGLSINDMAQALRLKPENGSRTIRRVEAGDSDLSGPVAVAVEAMLRGFVPLHMKGK